VSFALIAKKLANQAGMLTWGTWNLEIWITLFHSYRVYPESNSPKSNFYWSLAVGRVNFSINKLLWLISTRCPRLPR
jgi:hypothetical protein